MKEEIILTTTDSIPGIEYEIIGLVMGNKLTRLSSKKSSTSSLERLKITATEMGADAVVGIRPDTTATGSPCYLGTAVRFKK